MFPEQDFPAPSRARRAIFGRRRLPRSGGISFPQSRQEETPCTDSMHGTNEGEQIVARF